MRTGDEQTLAAAVRTQRVKRGLSQADLAERARVSAKTIQRLEAGQPVAAASRREVLAVLGIDPEQVPEDAGPASAAAHPDEDARWQVVAEARVLMNALIGARTVDIDVDREGWRRARRKRPWYRQDLAIAVGDPVSALLDLMDQVRDGASRTAGQKARQQEALAAALRASAAMRWALAIHANGSNELQVFVGAPETVAELATPTVR